MANNSAFRFAGVAQQPEHRVSRPEVGGKNPPPRSTEPIGAGFIPWPTLIASLALTGAIVVIVLVVAGVFR